VGVVGCRFSCNSRCIWCVVLLVDVAPACLAAQSSTAYQCTLCGVAFESSTLSLIIHSLIDPLNSSPNQVLE
jgi:hypothetical protein